MIGRYVYGRGYAAQGGWYNSPLFITLQDPRGVCMVQWFLIWRSLRKFWSLFTALWVSPESQSILCIEKLCWVINKIKSTFKPTLHLHSLSSSILDLLVYVLDQLFSCWTLIFVVLINLVAEALLRSVKSSACILNRTLNIALVIQFTQTIHQLNKYSTKQRHNYPPENIEKRFSCLVW